jgi:hypothetical protein
VTAGERSESSILKIIAMKKLSLAAVAVLSFALATVLLVRSLPHAPPQPDATASPRAAQTPAVQPGLSAQSPASRGDPDAFQKLVQRHEEQVRARGAKGVFNSRAQWDKHVAEFDDSLTPEPGVKKFGAKVQTTLAPGETLVTGGWSTHPGTRTFVFVTPQMTTPAGYPTNEGADQVTITSRFIAAPDPAFASHGMPVLEPQNESLLAGKLSDEQTRLLLTALETNVGSEVLSAPRVTSLLGMQSQVSVSDQRIIAGKNQNLGPMVDLFPARSQDGVSIDLGVLVRYTIADEAAPAGGP